MGAEGYDQRLYMGFRSVDLIIDACRLAKVKTLLYISLVLVLCSVGCTKKTSSDLIIATSANMQYAMQDIIIAFEQRHDIPCQTVVSSSGKLTAQITSGAPYDLFFSADKKYPVQLVNKGLTIDTPLVYAYGHLALWSTSIEKIDMAMLGTSAVQHIAIANPKTAPYGIAAQEMLDYYGLNKVDEKLVFGESISQVNQFVMSGVAEVGVTSLSVVLSSILKGQGHWTKVDENSYQPIAQSMVVVSKNESKLESAHLFKKFMNTLEVRRILERYGFSLVESDQ